MYRIADAAGAVQRVSDGVLIPADDRNKDWAAYQDWLKANQPEPFVPPPPGPRKLPARQVIGAMPAQALQGMCGCADARLLAGKTGEWAYLYQEAQWLESNPKLARLAAAGGIDVGALFDLALVR